MLEGKKIEFKFISFGRVFPTEGDGGSSPNSQKFNYPPPAPGRQISPNSLPPHQIVISPPPPLPPQSQFPTTKQQFPSYNSIKTAFLAVVIAPAPFLF